MLTCFLIILCAYLNLLTEVVFTSFYPVQLILLLTVVLNHSMVKQGVGGSSGNLVPCEKLCSRLSSPSLWIFHWTSGRVLPVCGCSAWCSVLDLGEALSPRLRFPAASPWAQEPMECPEIRELFAVFHGFEHALAHFVAGWRRTVARACFPSAGHVSREWK